MRTAVRVLLGAGAAARVAAGCSSSTTEASTSSTTAAPSGTAPSSGTGSTSGMASPDRAPFNPYGAYTSEVYAGTTNWLCRPDMADDVCHGDLDATVIGTDGSLEVVEAEPAVDDAPIDCFYVYPTISADDTANSDLTPGPEERNVVVQQAARLRSQCRVFAPVYRQNTLKSLMGSVESDLSREERAALAYGDVLDAWKQYLANDNDGRGVVLIGHSQGAGMLNQLIREEIDEQPEVRDHLLAAYLLGGGVTVPAGADVGGDFANVPACRTDDQLGCVVSFASFRATDPPPASSFFGRPRGGDGEVLCTNPAALAGGSAELDAYLPAGAAWLGDDLAAQIDAVRPAARHAHRRVRHQGRVQLPRDRHRRRPRRCPSRRHPRRPHPGVGSAPRRRQPDDGRHRRAGRRPARRLHGG
ncbi:MAG: DUF3089 domain-containing protein [Acidimicrobiales bacterium]